MTIRVNHIVAGKSQRLQIGSLDGPVHVDFDDGDVDAALSRLRTCAGDHGMPTTFKVSKPIDIVGMFRD